VLEIGVGMGADYVRWLRAEARVTGIDLTARAVAVTRARAEAEGFPDADVRQADAEHLPFADGSFDLVYSWGVLQHTLNTAHAARSCSMRSKTPSGRFIGRMRGPRTLGAPGLQPRVTGGVVEVEYAQMPGTPVVSVFCDR
jgi:ubiquinone/menaquinone biosynthesis C-methylase UbiE